MFVSNVLSGKLIYEYMFLSYYYFYGILNLKSQFKFSLLNVILQELKENVNDYDFKKAWSCSCSFNYSVVDRRGTILLRTTN